MSGGDGHLRCMRRWALVLFRPRARTCDCSQMRVAAPRHGAPRRAGPVPPPALALAILLGVATAADAAPPGAAPAPPPRGGPGGLSAAGFANRPPPQAAGEPAPADLADVRRRLVEQLERAAAAGLIELEDAPARPAPAPAPIGEAAAAETGNPGSPAEPRLSPAPTPAARADGPGPGEGETPEPPAPRGASRADTAPPAMAASTGPPDPAAPARRGGREAGPAPADAGAPAGCVPDAQLALPDPADHPDIAAEIARLRRGLVGEFDRPRADAAHDLARLYVALWMAPEARAVLAGFAGEDAQSRTLDWMARVVAGRPGPARAPGDCGDRESLWQAAAAAARGEAPRALALLRRAGRALQLMPAGPRLKFAVRLGAAAADLGDWASAARLEALARRASPGGRARPAGLTALSVRIALAAGRVDDAIAGLRSVWAQFPAEPEAGAALIELARRVLAGDVPGATDTRALRLDLGALALASRGGPQAAAAAQVESRLAARAFGQMTGLDILALHRRQGNVPEDAYAATVRAITARPAADRTAPPLALLFERRPERFSSVLDDPAFRSALALSFARIGQPARGEAVLEPEDRALPRVARRLAESYLAAGQPDAAAAMAARLADSPDKAVLTARIQEAQGWPARALATLLAADAGAPALRARLAWAAGDWAAAARALDSVAGDAPDPTIRARRDVAAARAASGARALDADRAIPAGAVGGPASVAAGIAPYLDRLGGEIDTMREALEDG